MRIGGRKCNTCCCCSRRREDGGYMYRRRGERRAAVAGVAAPPHPPVAGPVRRPRRRVGPDRAVQSHRRADRRLSARGRPGHNNQGGCRPAGGGRSTAAVANEDDLPARPNSARSDRPAIAPPPPPGRRVASGRSGRRCRHDGLGPVGVGSARSAPVRHVGGAEGGPAPRRVLRCQGPPHPGVAGSAGPDGGGRGSSRWRRRRWGR
mmetsp:Transcript_26232/g.61298  ORF Transcript_26232/g.61298 Transcript_26232/m.61298 type:complete len:206 (+) Transcript_26232:551-1168(+)